MKILLLAGGFGTRLSEKTDLKPKPMIEIGGKPILWHIMKMYSHYGFNDFVMRGIDTGLDSMMGGRVKVESSCKLSAGVFYENYWA